MRFADQVVLVTGSSRNTGFDIAAQFANEGATVFVHGSTADGVRTAACKLRAEGCERIVEAAADLGEPTAIRELIRKIRDRAGRLDVLVNNAVDLACGYSFEEVPLEMFEKAVRVNLIGPFYLAREVARMMMEQGSGAIINVGSNVSTRAIHKRSAYCATKGGLDAMTLAMAVDLGPHGIRVNTVAPGYIHTDRWDVLSEQDRLRRWANIPLGKEATGRDIADAVLFLASDAAANIHGARLVVDGGCSAQHLPADVDV